MNGSDDERALPSRIFASSGSSPVTASCSLFVSSHPLFDSIAEGIALKSAILFNDSRLSLKRPPFPDRLASTFLPAREERCLSLAPNYTSCDSVAVWREPPPTRNRSSRSILGPPRRY